MTFPLSNPVAFPPSTGNLTVTSVTVGTSAGGNPVGSVIDIDTGFLVSGTVSVPDWLPGSGTAKGQVNLYADELGGSINASIGKDDVNFTGVAKDPSGMLTVNWSIPVTTGSGIPDPQPGNSQLYHLAVVFTYGAQTTDIAAFVDLGMYVVN